MTPKKLSEEATVVKPCPYCGGTEVELLQFDEDGDYAAMFCRKKNCGASGPTVDADHDDLDEYDEETTYPKALKAWNSRVNHASAFAELVEAFREYVDCHGGAHEEGCPADDTCSCKWKPLNDRVNAALRRVEG